MRALRPGISVPDPPRILPPPEHPARHPRMPPDARVCRSGLRMSRRARLCRLGPAHVVRRPRMPPGAAHVVRRLGTSLGVRARRPTPRTSSGASHVARGRRMALGARHGRPAPCMASGVYAYRSAPAHVVRHPACRPTRARVALGLRISLGACGRSFCPPRAGAPQGCVSSERAGHLWTPRPPPTPPPDPRRATHRAPEPAQVVPGPGQGRGGVSRPACAVTRAAAPPPPCPGWSPRRRESAGTRRCAGGATHGRPRA
ncbi:hypothetical protein SAMN05446589_2228 [Streptomyces sp. OV198]|nr:hypothetical protein SAMN05446589_2228 [Streptomyces sp. OV198]